MKRLFIAAAVFFTLTACDQAVTNGVNQIAAPEDSGDTAIPSDMQLAEPSILSMTYRRATHDLSIDLEYGGCSNTTHKLIIDVCQESYPARCIGKLVRPKSYNASCKALIRDTLVVELEASLDMSYVVLNSADGSSKSALVDKTGKGGPIPPGEGDENKVETANVSDATIKSAAYDKATHSLKLELQYSGCTQAKHDLVFGEICAASFPSGCGAQIVREDAGEVSCDAIQQETLTYKLKEAQDAMVLTITNKAGKGPNILIDHYGKVAAQTTPP